MSVYELLDAMQGRAVEAIEHHVEAGTRSAVIEMPTGTGKSRTFCMWGKMAYERRGWRGLILAHIGELMDQAAASWERWTELPCVIEKAEQRARTPFEEFRIPAVIGSIQTLRGDRLLDWPKDSFDYIVTDECHHALGDSYGKIYDHFDFKFHLGASATLERLDGGNLGRVYQRKAFVLPLDDAIEGGLLCPYEAVVCRTDVSLKGLTKVGDDFNQGELDERISASYEVLCNAVRQEQERLGFKRPLVFTPRVQSAHDFANGLTQIGIPSRGISGKSKDRRSLVQQFRDGAFDGFCNSQLFAEGTDFPFVDAVVMAKPTMSESRYRQMLGRGLRLWEGKEKCYVIDFAFLTDKFNPVSTVDLVAGAGHDKEARKLAKEIMAKKETTDPKEALRRASERQMEMWERGQEEQRRRLLSRISVRQRQVGYTRRQFNPLGVRPKVRGKPVVESWASRRILATENQQNALRRFGVDPAGMSRRTASGLLESLFAERDARRRA